MTDQTGRFREKKSLKRMFKEQGGMMAAWFALMIPVFIGITALALDMSYAMLMRQRLQVTASTAALAGAKGLADSEAQARALADGYAATNLAHFGDVLKDVDIKLGSVDMSTDPRGDFVDGLEPYNAVQVTTRLEADGVGGGNPLGLFLAGIAGLSTIDINAVATAITVNQAPPAGCLIALKETSTETGLLVRGEAELRGDGCGICVNSTRPSQTVGPDETGGMQVNGHPTVDVGGSEGTLGAILVAGHFATNGSNVVVNPEPDYNLDTVVDGTPLCADPCGNPDAFPHFLVDPNVCTDPSLVTMVDGDPFVTVNGNLVPFDPLLETGQTIRDPFNPVPGSTAIGDKLPAGVHCNPGTFAGGTSLEFASGVHIFVDTVFDIHGKSDIDPATGRSRYVTSGTGGNTFVLSGSNLNISNGSSFNFEGSLDVDGNPGLLFWQDPRPGREAPDPPMAPMLAEDPPVRIAGGSNFFLDGTLYFGLSDIELTGSINQGLGAPDCLTLLAGTFEIAGSPGEQLNLSTAGCGAIADLPPIAVAVRLVQ